MYTKNSIQFCILSLVLSSCVYNEIPTGQNCTDNPLITPTVVVVDASSCTAADGQVTITASGGVPPYTYSWNNGAFQESPVITGRSAAACPITVKDSRGCTIDLQVTVNATGSTLAASATLTPDNTCFPPHNGSISIVSTAGTPPYEVKFGSGDFGTDTVFDGLQPGDYTVVVRDAASCTLTLGVEVLSGDTGTSFSSEVNPILSTHCAIAGCHVGGGLPSFTTYAGVAAQASRIKARTANGSMPPAGRPDLTAQQIQLIACWVDDGAKNN